MANLETYLAETRKSYDNSRNALQNQLNSIQGDLDAEQGRINAQFAQQAQNIDRNRNYAAQAASMRAGSTGGSFGGSAGIANKKYYQQAFVPAMTQMQTNQANALGQAQSAANKHRQNLEYTLAGLEDEATRIATQRYDQAVAQERQEALERERLAEQRRQFNAQQAQQNAWQKYLRQPAQSGNNLKYGFRQGNDGNVWYHNNATGKDVRFGTYVDQFGGNFNNQAQQMLRQGDDEMRWLANYLGGQQIAYTGGGGKNYYNPGAIRGGTNQKAANIMNRLGIHLVGNM